MPGDPKFESVSVAVLQVSHETEKAILCTIDGGDVWIPKSQIRDGSDVEGLGDSGDLVIPRWLADEHEFDYEEYE